MLRRRNVDEACVLRFSWQAEGKWHLPYRHVFSGFREGGFCLNSCQDLVRLTNPPLHFQIFKLIHMPLTNTQDSMYRQRYSCDRCRQQKVRCLKNWESSAAVGAYGDHVTPCERCTKADVACVYSCTLLCLSQTYTPFLNWSGQLTVQ